MWTSLAHPVEFLAECPPDGSRPCHWCNNYAYGITGLGPRNPEIWEFDDGTLVELEDGHIGEGKEQSRMCVSCTWDRYKIMRCSHTTLSPLPTSLSAAHGEQRDMAFEYLAKAQEALIDPVTQLTGPAFAKPTYEWCSICKEPAFGLCKTLQPIDVHAEVVDLEQETLGCGLALCESCYSRTTKAEGNLDAVVAGANCDLRADAHYLQKEAGHNTIYRALME
jgi:hypothetical protein